MAGYTINLPKSSLTSSGSYIEGKIRLEQTKDEATLSSSVTAKLYVRKGNTTTTLTEPTEGTWSYKLQIGNTVVNKTVSKAVLTNWVHLDTLSVNLDHASNGTLSVRIIASITAPSGTTLAGKTTNYDQTLSLGSIALPTTIDSLTCSTDYVDGVITAKYTPRGATFYNQCKAYVNVNGTLTEIYTQNLGQKTTGQKTHTIQFTAEQLSKIYGAVKTTINATIRVRFLTYKNSTYTSWDGTVHYLEIVLTLPTSVAPTASLTLKPVNSNSWIAGKNIYVAGLSGLTATLSATPSAGIKEEELTTTITYDGATYNAKTLNVTTLKKSGNIVAKVTDPRGRFATDTEPITVLPYSAPVIASMQVARGTYDNGWEATDEGSDVRVTFKTTLSLKDNGNAYSAAFKVDGSSKIPNYGATTELKSGTDCTVYFLGINGEASHTLAMTVTDKTGGTGTANITIPTIHITIEFNDSGKGIAFGKTSEKDAFECAWPAYFNKAVYITDKITCPNDFALRNFNINCNWADGAAHDLIVRENDGLTTGIGWSGNGDDGKSYETALDVRPKHVNFRGVVTASRGRFTTTTDLSGEEQNDVALRLGDADGQHIDMDTNEIQAKTDPTTPGPLYLNLDGGDVSVNGFRIPQIQRGSVRITPTAANTPTSLNITFDKEFSGTPTVIATPYTAVPGTTVLGVGVNGANSKGCTIWVTRNNTTETVVHWIAVY